VGSVELRAHTQPDLYGHWHRRDTTKDLPRNQSPCKRWTLDDVEAALSIRPYDPEIRDQLCSLCIHHMVDVSVDILCGEIEEEEGLKLLDSLIRQVLGPRENE